MIESLMIALAIVSFVWIGYEIACRRAVAKSGGFEFWCAALTIGAAAWVASAWTIALLGLLTRPAIIIRTIVVTAAAVALFLARKREAPRRLQTETLIAVVQVLLWLAFIAWRSWVVPPLSHDALAYHLPRAVFWIRAQGFTFLDLPVDVRMSILPANYELLLADVMLLGEGDRLTESIAVLFYGAFVVACGAMAQRWWRLNGGPALLATVLLTASVPVLLLHAGADKNDTMTAFFMVSAMVWAGRWLSERDLDALTLCIVALAAAAGTKPQGVMLGIALAPIVLYRLRFHARAWLRVAVAGALSFFLLGGTFYVVRAMHRGSANDFVRYDDWANVWQAPWVLLTAPFSPWSNELFVPWSQQTWFWSRGEIYFSHLGVPFAICAVLLPVTWWFFRRDIPERALERVAIALAALVTFLLMLPVRDVPMPHGVFVVALPRYVLFLVPVVFAATIVPALARLSVRQMRYVVAAFAVWFVHQAVSAAMNDRFVPIRFVLAASRHPGTRVIPFDPVRPASIVDKLAGPDQTIAFDAGYAAWIHPAFGRNLRRPVVFTKRGDGPPVIPDSARWVVVDRSFPVIWQHKDFRDISQWRKYLGRGRPAPEDMRVIRYLLDDPRFELVGGRVRMGEAVFRRR